MLKLVMDQINYFLNVLLLLDASKLYLVSQDHKLFMSL